LDPYLRKAVSGYPAKWCRCLLSPMDRRGVGVGFDLSPSSTFPVHRRGACIGLISVFYHHDDANMLFHASFCSSNKGIISEFSLFFFPLVNSKTKAVKQWSFWSPTITIFSFYGREEEMRF
jgi:hypothetical protein